jgi:ankyrin repeat protein
VRVWLAAALASAGLGAGSGPAWAEATLADAAETGDLESARALIADGADVNARKADGTTALHWAAYRGDVALADALLAAGADPSAVNDYGSTPLLEAAVVGDVDLLRRLLDAGAAVDTPGADGQTALMVIARTANLEAAELLIDRGADVNIAESWGGQTALMWAVAQRQPEMTALLVAHGADVDARSRFNDWQRQVTAESRVKYIPMGGFTPLIYAAREGCLACARTLIEAGADLDKADPEEVSPLLLAIQNAHYDTARLLLESGADPDKWSWYGESPLYAAVDLNTIPNGGRPDRPSLDATSSFEMVELLLAAGANPNLQLKFLPPFRSVGADRGADLLLTTGATPLLRAAKAGDADSVRLLLEHGAIPDLPQQLGITPLMAAAGIGRQSNDTRGRFTSEEQALVVIRQLLDAGADVHAKDRFGRTAIHGAAIFGWNDLIEALVEAGGDPSIADDNDDTPLDYALGQASGRFRGVSYELHEDTAALLRELTGASEEAALE